MAPEIEDKVIELYKTYGIYAISAQLQIPYREVGNILKRRNVPIRLPKSKTPRPRKPKKISLEWKYNLGLARLVAIYTLGGKCVVCGCSDYRVLELNHVNGQKPKYAARVDRKTELHSIIHNKGSTTVEVRCANCNVLHEFERGKRKDALRFIDEHTGQPTALFSRIVVLTNTACAG